MFNFLPNIRIRLPLVVMLVLVGCDRGQSGSPGSAKSKSTAAKERSSSSQAAVPVKTKARFEDVTNRSSVDFTYRNDQENDQYVIVESLGGGVGLFDFDRDGDVDIFLPGGGHYVDGTAMTGNRSAMYRNEGNWRFTEVSDACNVAEAPYYSHGIAAGDFDNDGFPDALVTGYGGLVLFHNRGDGTFEEITTDAALTDKLWSSSAAWGDINGDGDPDLYVAHYANWSFENNPHCPGPQPGQREVCPPREFDPLPDILYLSNGDGTFRDASQEVGLKPVGKGLGVLIADVDLDGDLDVYVGNDTVANLLYRNDGGVFEEIGLVSGTAMGSRGTPDGSMGVDLGDFNLDGLPDLWVANYESESFALYRNQGNCFFQHVSQSMGITSVGGLFVGWGTAFFDFDADGDEDIICSNGHVIRHPRNAPLRQNPLLFENRDGKRFENVAPEAGNYLASRHLGRGLAVGDLDNDGDQDLVISHLNEQVAILSNESVQSNHWVAFDLIGTRSSRDAVGAIVTLRLNDRSERIRQIKPAQVSVRPVIDVCFLGWASPRPCNRRQFDGRPDRNNY
jgi:hypothetical protein